MNDPIHHTLAHHFGPLTDPHQEVERLFTDALTDPKTAIPYQTHRMINRGQLWP
jgi:hypothetical protein